MDSQVSTVDCEVCEVYVDSQVSALHRQSGVSSAWTVDCQLGVDSQMSTVDCEVCVDSQVSTVDCEVCVDSQVSALYRQSDVSSDSLSEGGIAMQLIEGWIAVQLIDG